MPLQLFLHNMQAYEAAKSMPDKTYKAAGIHPIGSDQSFIPLFGCSRRV